MKTQFTTGPWHVNSPYIEDQHGTIAKVMRPEDNAAIIAAAPELLEALENALNVLAGIATGDLKTINRDSPVIIKARAAIAKARGNL